MDKIYFSNASFTFIQEGNTLGTTSETEEISLSLESATESLDEEAGFWVMKTTGWSFNNTDELIELFNRIKKIK